MAYNGDYEDGTTDDDYTNEDLLQLNRLCAAAFPPPNKTDDAKYQSEMSWEPVREWINSHSKEEIQQAAVQLGDSNMTALHFACRNGSPNDVIDTLISVAHEAVEWPDSFGWLPIHYACACGADAEVIKKLAETFPDSKTSVDRRGRTPLHFALGNQNPDQLASPAVVSILSSSGAAAVADEQGMLPLHYACAYGASEEALMVLTDRYKEAITTMDVKNRTPLHFALSNAGRKASPGAVRHLLSLDRKLVNSMNGGPLPLRVLSEFAFTLRKNGTEEDKANVAKCLEHLLNAQPNPTADFFTALQALPQWLSEKAVVIPSVQVLLNDKISQRFPTFVLMCDLVFLILVIIFYSIDVLESIQLRAKETEQSGGMLPVSRLVPLYIGAAIFFLREAIQILSLISLKSFHIWLCDLSNWLNVVFIVLVTWWAVCMQMGLIESLDNFRTGTAFTVIVLWLKVLGYLRNMLIDFAVFVGGVLHVVQRLAAFLAALVVILVAFSQMFLTVFRQTPYCTNPPDVAGDADKWCEDYRPFCAFWTSFLSVYTMLLGEVDEEKFQSSKVATFLFCLFMFLVVILLANVLIAIVTDSYKVIQYERAAIVFWTNRLDFVAEMDAIANGPWKKPLKSCCGMGKDDKGVASEGSTFGKELWKRLMDLFDDDIEESYMSAEYFADLSLRVFTAAFIFFWILLGISSLGYLWPPQVRVAIFTSAVRKHSSESAEEDELRKTQVALLQREVMDLREDLTQELAGDRTQVVQMKTQIDHRRTEMDNELRNIKRIVTMLFEQQATMC
jgi:hypothetical protein